MAIQKDPEGLEELKQVLGRRLRAARRASGLSEWEASAVLNHKGITQVSLAESGQRIPPLLDLMKYADLYCVPLDFLLGRLNDPLAEPEEHGQSLITRNVSKAIMGCFERFSQSVAEQSAVCISGHRADRIDIREAVVAAKEAREALKRVKELNKDYEDLRGGAKLESTLNSLMAIGERVERRIIEEGKQLEVIDKALKLEEIEGNISQFSLTLA